MRLVTFLILPCTFYLVPCTSVADAATVTLAWDKNAEVDIAGYKIHYGTASRNYLYHVDVKNNTSCSISGLNEGETYYLTATAYNASLIDSSYSTELVYTVPVADADGDGIADEDETSIYGTDPHKIDTDGDGINDGAEIALWGNDWDADFDGDGLINLLDPDSDNDGYPDGSPSLPLPTQGTPAQSPIMFEVGEIQIDHNWQSVEFSKPFTDPIVVSNSLSLNGVDPAVIRIRNVDENGFEIRVQEWDYLDGWHKMESVSYLVMERGSYVLEDGTKVEAGKFESNKTKGFENISFDSSFHAIPVVTTSIMSVNEADAVTTRIRNIDSQSFQFRMQEQELNAKNHAGETIGYIAWELSTGIIDGRNFEVGKTGDSVGHKFYTIQFAQNFVNTPAFIASMQTGDGMNTANVRWRNRDAYVAEVFIDEEQSKDDEIRHGTEVVGYMVFSDSGF